MAVNNHTSIEKQAADQAIFINTALKGWRGNINVLEKQF